MKYKVCPECSAMYDADWVECDLHGTDRRVTLRPATDEEVRTFEERNRP